MLKKIKTVLISILVLVTTVQVYKQLSRKDKNDLPSQFESRRFNFSLMLPYIEPTVKNRQLWMVILVNSAAKGTKHRLLRQSIRITWGNNSKEQQLWGLYFVLGVSESKQGHVDNLKEASRWLKSLG